MKLSGPVDLVDQWIELEAKPPLRADNDLQMILLDLAPPYKDDFFNVGTGPHQGLGILMPEGDVSNPDIEVIDQDGKVFHLVYAGGTGPKHSPVYGLPYPAKWPKDKVYKMVRLRSSRLIKCEAIFWFCESTKDWR